MIRIDETGASVAIRLSAARQRGVKKTLINIDSRVRQLDANSGN